MEFEIIYPVLPPRSLFYERARRVILSIYAIAFAACGIINLCVGGYPWSLIVFGGQWLFWISVVERPLVEFTFLSKFSAILINVCIFLVIVDVIIGNGFSLFVVPIICFSILIVQALVFLIGFKRQKGNLMPVMMMTVVGLIALALAHVGVLEMRWPTMVLGSISIFMIVFSLGVFFRPLRLEVTKKFNVN